MTWKNNRAPLLYYIKLCASFQIHRSIQIGVTIRVKIGDFLSCVTLKFNRWPKKQRAHHLCYVKLRASHQSHRWIQTWVIARKLPIRVKISDFVWIQTGVTVRKRSIRVNIGDVLSHLNFRFDGWPWKTIGHLFFVASSFVHHFIAISEFKLDLLSGNAQFGSKSTFFVSCDHDVRWMTLRNNRASLLCYFKLCASFRNHWWIETGVTVRKRPSWVKINDFFSTVTLKFDGWPWKPIAHLS